MTLHGQRESSIFLTKKRNYMYCTSKVYFTHCMTTTTLDIGGHPKFIKHTDI
jgi:hypothetical protein